MEAVVSFRGLVFSQEMFNSLEIILVREDLHHTFLHSVEPKKAQSVVQRPSPNSQTKRCRVHVGIAIGTPLKIAQSNQCLFMFLPKLRSLTCRAPSLAQPTEGLEGKKLSNAAGLRVSDSSILDELSVPLDFRWHSNHECAQNACDYNGTADQQNRSTPTHLHTA
jgi:hypothetical protein